MIARVLVFCLLKLVMESVKAGLVKLRGGELLDGLEIRAA
jgi:hypothetical protein